MSQIFIFHYFSIIPKFIQSWQKLFSSHDIFPLIGFCLPIDILFEFYTSFKLKHYKNNKIRNHWGYITLCMDELPVKKQKAIIFNIKFVHLFQTLYQLSDFWFF